VIAREIKEKFTLELETPEGFADSAISFGQKLFRIAWSKIPQIASQNGRLVLL
jgi:hypothetical protein